jgi:ubiquitin carboxyl-terminal hydrolase 8
VDFTYPSLEESVPSKPPAQMPPSLVEGDKNTDLISDQDERMGTLTMSATGEPTTASKADVSSTLQPVHISKNIPQVLS